MQPKIKLLSYDVTPYPDKNTFCKTKLEKGLLSVGYDTWKFSNRYA